MKTKTIPAILMLLAGFIACLAGIYTHMEVADFMKMLLIVLIIFYIFGCIVKVIIDKNFVEMQEETTDGEEPGENEDSGTDEEDAAEVKDEDE